MLIVALRLCVRVLSRISGLILQPLPSPPSRSPVYLHTSLIAGQSLANLLRRSAANGMLISAFT